MARVRLSTVDLLPPEADADVIWAVAEIEAGKRLVKDIREEFNSRLADRGIGPISDSSFSRYAVRKRAAFQQLKEVRDISNAIASSLEPGSDAALTMTIAQFAKTAMFRIFEKHQDVDSTSIMEIGRALQAIENAKKSAAAHAKEAKKDRAAEKAEQEAAAKAVDTIETVAKEAGLSKETIRQMKRDFLGVRPKKKAEPDG